MKPWELLGETSAPDGSRICLVRRDTEYVIRVDGKILMSSRMHGSEEALATAGCHHLRQAEAPRVLIGGLGMGFTLAAALKELPADARVIVAELVPAVIEWNRGVLGECAGHPLADRRVRIEVGDVGHVVRANTGRLDAVLLDVDNGPSAFTTLNNEGLYDNGGVDACYRSLRPGGVLAVWSAWEDRKFDQRLRFYGFDVRVDRVRARLKSGGPRHTIFVAVKHDRSGRAPGTGRQSHVRL
jgi:spermidine synthase